MRPPHLPAYGWANSSNRRKNMSNVNRTFGTPFAKWFVIGAFTAVVLALGACGNPAQTAKPVTQATAAQQVTLHGKEFSFSPNAIQLKVGQPVQLTLANDGTVDHDIKSDIPISNLAYQTADNATDEQAANAADGVFDVDYNQGHTARITFVPTKAGTYQFFCDVPDHKEAGMTGTFVVQD